MPIAIDAIRAEFAGIVGERRVVYDARACALLGVGSKIPTCVVYATSPEQVAQSLKCAAERDLAVIPVGSGTKLGIGNLPQRYDVALCLQEMNRVRHYEPSDLTVGVEAGLKLQDFQNLTSCDGLWLPLDPPGGGQSTIGGIVATNSAGALRHYYGAPRDMVLGITIATTEGKLVKTGGRVVKNVAGYDLGKLVIHSFGTLGVIVEVNLKLYPIPAQRQTFALSTGTLGIARDLRQSILQSPIEPMKLVLLDAEAARFLRCDPTIKVYEPEIWVEASGSKSVIERTRRELEALGRAVGAKVRSLDDETARVAWQSISDFNQWLGHGYPASVILGVTLPIANIEEYLSLAQQEAGSEKIRMASAAQAGIGVISLGLFEAERSSRIAELIARLRKAAEGFGGALTVMICSTDLKARVDVWGMRRTDLAIMNKIKAVWDPKGILAPGRL